MSTGDHDAILSIVDQLEKCTEQLSRCGENSEQDVPVLTRACRSHLTDLREAMSSGLDAIHGAHLGANPTEESVRIVDALKALQAKTDYCLSVLQEALNRKEEEMASFRTTRKAIMAYGRGSR